MNCSNLSVSPSKWVSNIRSTTGAKGSSDLSSSAEDYLGNTPALCKALQRKSWILMKPGTSSCCPSGYPLKSLGYISFCSSAKSSSNIRKSALFISLFSIKSIIMLKIWINTVKNKYFLFKINYKISWNEELSSLKNKWNKQLL